MMTKKTRRKIDAALKAKIALEALREHLDRFLSRRSRRSDLLISRREARLSAARE